VEQQVKVLAMLATWIKNRLIIDLFQQLQSLFTGGFCAAE
jgi:hypothetical protein